MKVRDVLALKQEFALLIGLQILMEEQAILADLTASEMVDYDKRDRRVSVLQTCLCRHPSSTIKSELRPRSKGRLPN